jgi:hypothetical protein
MSEVKMVDDIDRANRQFELFLSKYAHAPRPSQEELLEGAQLIATVTYNFKTGETTVKRPKRPAKVRKDANRKSAAIPFPLEGKG